MKQYQISGELMAELMKYFLIDGMATPDRFDRIAAMVRDKTGRIRAREEYREALERKETAP